MFSEMTSAVVPTTLTLFTGCLLLSRSWLIALRHDRARLQNGPELASHEDVELRPSDASPANSDGGMAELLDISEEVGSALHRLDRQAARDGVRLEVAIEPELRARMPRAGFRRALDTMIGHAIAQAPCGKVMIGAMRHGGRVRLVVLDDGGGPDRLRQESRLRDVVQIVALQGGTIEITTRLEGSTVTMRLPEAGSGATLPTRSPMREAAAQAPAPAAAALPARVEVILV